VPKVSDAHLTARRRQILDAAARCFARDGFHRTSMQDIVRETGISAGLVYRYFDGKDAIITAIVTEWHDQRRSALDPRRDTAGHPDEPSDLAASYLDLLRSVGRPQALEDLRLAVQVWAEAVRTPQIRELVRGGVDGPRLSAAELIRAAQAGGGFSPGLDPDALARILIAVYQGLTLQTAWDDTVDNDAFVRTLETILGTLTARY
jgi:AcrR family transcriptional regulator